MTAAFLVALSFAAAFGIGWLRAAGERNRLRDEVQAMRTIEVRLAAAAIGKLLATPADRKRKPRRK